MATFSADWRSVGTPGAATLSTYLSHLDEQRIDLRKKREALEERAAGRQARMKQFSAIRSQFVKKAQRRLKDRRRVADERSRRLKDATMRLTLSTRPTGSQDAVEEARKAYFKGVTEEYPRWKKQWDEKIKERGKELDREAAELELRRKLAQETFERELATRESVGKKVQELAISKTKLLSEEAERELARQQLLQKQMDLEEALHSHTLRSLERLREKVLGEMEKSKREMEEAVADAMRHWEGDSEAREQKRAERRAKEKELEETRAREEKVFSSEGLPPPDAAFLGYSMGRTFQTPLRVGGLMRESFPNAQPASPMDPNQIAMAAATATAAAMSAIAAHSQASPARPAAEAFSYVAGAQPPRAGYASPSHSKQTRDSAEIEQPSPATSAISSKPPVASGVRSPMRAEHPLPTEKESTSADHRQGSAAGAGVPPSEKRLVILHEDAVRALESCSAGLLRKLDAEHVPDTTVAHLYTAAASPLETKEKLVNDIRAGRGVGEADTATLASAIYEIVYSKGSKMLPENLLWGQLREEELRDRLQQRHHRNDAFAKLWRGFESHVEEMLAKKYMQPEDVDGIFMPCFVRPGAKYEARLHRKYRTALRLLLVPKPQSVLSALSKDTSGDDLFSSPSPAKSDSTSEPSSVGKPSLSSKPSPSSKASPADKDQEVSSAAAGIPATVSSRRRRGPPAASMLPFDVHEPEREEKKANLSTKTSDAQTSGGGSQRTGKGRGQALSAADLRRQHQARTKRSLLLGDSAEDEDSKDRESPSGNVDANLPHDFEAETDF